MKKYNKLWIALLAGISALAFACAPTATEAVFVITPAEWYNIAIAFLVAFGVYRIPNSVQA